MSENEGRVQDGLREALRSMVAEHAKLDRTSDSVDVMLAGDRMADIARAALAAVPAGEYVQHDAIHCGECGALVLLGGSHLRRTVENPPPCPQCSAAVPAPNDERVRCSFCGRAKDGPLPPQFVPTRIVGGPGDVRICDRCVQECAALLAGGSPNEAAAVACDVAKRLRAWPRVASNDTLFMLLDEAASTLTAMAGIVRFQDRAAVAVEPTRDAGLLEALEMAREEMESCPHCCNSMTLDEYVRTALKRAVAVPADTPPRAEPIAQPLREALAGLVEYVEGFRVPSGLWIDNACTQCTTAAISDTFVCAYHRALAALASSYRTATGAVAGRSRWCADSGCACRCWRFASFPRRSDRHDGGGVGRDRACGAPARCEHNRRHPQSYRRLHARCRTATGGSPMSLVQTERERVEALERENESLRMIVASTLAAPDAVEATGREPWKLEDAIAFAAKAHAGQVYRGYNGRPDEPYIRHALRCVAQIRGTEAQIVAALHDVLEDTEYAPPLDALSEEQWGALRLLTRGDDDAYEDYITGIALSRNPLAQIAKIADLRDNLAHDPPPRLRKRYEAALFALGAPALPVPARPPEPGTIALLDALEELYDAPGEYGREKQNAAFVLRKHGRLAPVPEQAGPTPEARP